MMHPIWLYGDPDFGGIWSREINGILRLKSMESYPPDWEIPALMWSMGTNKQWNPT
jgi:hypothetical protein